MITHLRLRSYIFICEVPQETCLAFTSERILERRGAPLSDSIWPCERET